METETITPNINGEDGLKSLTSIMIVDDHPLVRQALRTLIQSQHDFRLIAEASSGEEAITLATDLIPEVIIMDITMPGINGLEATKIIKEKCPNVKILVLTVHSDNEHILGILEAGAAGYLTKNVFGEEVVTAIRAIVAGENVICSQLLYQVLKDNRNNGDSESSSQSPALPFGAFLTSREESVLRLLAKGMSNRDISITLGLSLQTIKGYSVNIFAKLGASSRTEAVVKALRLGVLTIEDIS